MVGYWTFYKTDILRLVYLFIALHFLLMFDIDICTIEKMAWKRLIVVGVQYNNTCSTSNIYDDEEPFHLPYNIQKTIKIFIFKWKLVESKITLYAPKWYYRLTEGWYWPHSKNSSFMLLGRDFNIIVDNQFNPNKFLYYVMDVVYCKINCKWF